MAGVPVVSERLQPPVAIVGIGCRFPHAPHARAYWASLLRGVSPFEDVPRARWEIDRYHATDPAAPDRGYARRAAFLPEVPFDWKKFRIPPRLAGELNPMHLALLDVTSEALEDAGPASVERNRRTGFIIGSMGLGLTPDQPLRVRAADYLDALAASLEARHLDAETRERVVQGAATAIRSRLRPIVEDNVLGAVASIAVGRVMNHFGLRGPHLAIDAGYGSSLAAVDAAMLALADGSCDRVIVAGASPRLFPVDLVTFSRLGAFASHDLVPFDARADGTLFGEGVGVVVLERADDAAQRAKPPYAIIAGIGAASNGAGPALFAPSADAEALAMRRALASAALAPGDVQFVECHATGTPLGDRVEVSAIASVFSGLPRHTIGLGSVKEQIGHLQSGAGIASLIKVALALRYDLIPRQHRFQSAPDDFALADSPLHVQVTSMPWSVRASGRRPCACVNSIGFGGVNYTACVESAASEPRAVARAPAPARAPRDAIAIIGMGAVFPGAPDVDTFWRNNVEEVDSVRCVPPTRFPIDRYFDASGCDTARSYTRLCTVVDDAESPPALLRMPPATARQIDPTQMLALRATAQALTDAGLMAGGFDRDETAVIMADMPQRKRETETVIRLGAAEYRAAVEPLLDAGSAAVLDDADMQFKRPFPPVTEDTLVGYLGGVISGRIARHFGFRGPNFGVESACASSLYAIALACQGLQQGRFSVAVAGGVCCNTSPEVFSIACAFKGLSSRGISPFDACADGFIGGEGAGVVVLKRLRDARRAGDRILAVVRGVGASSDGGSKSVFAPDPAGQALAIERALTDARVAPEAVDYIECHGTGTYTGDVAEVSAYAQVYGGHGRATPIALSSVKSMIGHLNAAAGIASIIRVVCALGHGVIPPTLHFQTPNPDAPFGAGPFVVAATPLSWPFTVGRPRRAAVSSFGLGGSNVHVILEAPPEEPV